MGGPKGPRVGWKNILTGAERTLKMIEEPLTRCQSGLKRCTLQSTRK
jgi:hypothetical protein